MAKWVRVVKGTYGVGKAMYKGYRIGQDINRLRRAFSRDDRKSKRAKVTRGNLTFQNDEAMMYRRKRAPRRVRRRAKRSFQRFTYNLDKTQGMKTCITQSYSGVVTGPGLTVATGQRVFGITMYGYGQNSFATNVNPANGDIPWIFAQENGAYPTATDATRKLRFRSAVLDITIRNSSTLDGEDEVDGILQVDIYRVVARKNILDPAVTGGDPAAFFDASIAKEVQGNMPVGITTSAYNGVTPFDSPAFGSAWRIVSTRRVRLSPGQIWNGQLRDPKNYVLDMDEITGIAQKRNVTEGYLVIVKNASFVQAFQPGSFSYSVHAVKTYHYAETLVSQDTIGA